MRRFWDDAGPRRSSAGLIIFCCEPMNAPFRIRGEKVGWLWLALLSSMVFCHQLRSQTLTAVNDSVFTGANTSIAISVLTNDLVVASNQTAILRVTQPL